jgi:hypothetical protein
MSIGHVQRQEFGSKIGSNNSTPVIAFEESNVCCGGPGISKAFMQGNFSALGGLGRYQLSAVELARSWSLGCQRYIGSPSFLDLYLLHGNA